MKKIKITALMLLFASILVQAQNDFPRKNAVFGEFGGTAFFHSINYERKFSLSDYTRISTGVGFSVKALTYKPAFLPLATIGFLYGKKHNMEIGLGLCYDTKNNDIFLLSGKIGYRYESRAGFQYRLGLTPFYRDSYSGADGNQVYSPRILPWAYMSFGYSF